MAKPKLYPKTRITPQDKDLPATQGMLYLVRDELKSDLASVKAELKGDIADLKAELKGDIADLKTELKDDIAKVDGRVYQLSSEVHQLSSEICRLGVLIEQQNARNTIVLEALTGQAQRQDRLEIRVDEVEKTVRSIARVKA